MVKINRDSWGKVSKWYDQSVSDRGQYYHEHVIIPNVIRLLDLLPNSRLLDVGCGQGVLARAINPEIAYTGVDISPELIRLASKRDRNPGHHFVKSNATEKLPADKTFTHAAAVLSIQNMKNSRQAMINVGKALLPGGIFVIILNHPMFRIPRQSAWGIDEKNKLQYRKVFRYLSPLEIPVTVHPGRSSSPVTWNYHQPLSTYSNDLTAAGLVIERIEEWSSDRESTGKASRMENRARAEIPLFMAIKTIKLR